MTNASEKLERLFESWKQEHRRLNAYVLELMEWFHGEGHVTTPPFVLAAEKLSALRGQLQEHFSKEEEIGRLLAQSRGQTTREIDAVCRQNDKAHAQLEQRIAELIIRLGTADAEKDHWNIFTQEFDLLVDAIEQHEEQEAAHVQWLTP